MTLNDIIISALTQLDRGYDAKTVEIYRTRLTQYANDGQDDLALSLGLTKTETRPAANGVMDTNTLSRRCLRVERVCQRGHEVPFRTGSLMNRILLPYEEPAEVTYRFLPNRLERANDVSELPEFMHSLIVTYVVGRERMGGDTSTQSGANIYLSMYNAAKAKLRGYIRDADSFSITNRY